MKPRSLLVAAVLLAALSGAVWWAKKHPESASTASSTAGTNVKLVDIPADQLQQIAVKKKDGSQISLKRQSGKWEIISPENLPADQDTVSSLTSALAPLNAESVVEEKASDTAKYGLTSPSLTLSLNRANGATDTILFGDDAPAGSLIYVQHGTDPKIYAVNSSAKSSFDKTVNDLRDKRLLTFSSDKLTGLEVDGKKGPVAFAKNNQGDWQIVKPAAFRADSFQVEDLIRKLQDARMDLSGSADDQKKAAALYGTGEPVAAVKVSDSSGTQSLDIRKNKADYYAKSSVVSGNYKVSSDLGSALDKSLTDFRAHKLYDFGFSDPTKVEFRNGSTDTVYQKSGQDWKSNGKTMDAATVQSVIDQVRDLAATDFPTTGFANPSIDITVVSNDGKRTEKVSFAKTSEKYIAKREGEPALYEINAKNVDDIVKAFGQIKPAAAPAKK
jgi:hypothetical protein